MSKPVSEARHMIESSKNLLRKTKQCSLLGIHHSGLYSRSVSESQENKELMRLMEEQYIQTLFYGVARMQAWLQDQGIEVNRKHVERLMRLMALPAIYRESN